MESIKDAYRQAWETLIKPTKYHYDLQDLGEKEKVIKGQSIIREDFEVKNHAGKKTLNDLDRHNRAKMS